MAAGFIYGCSVVAAVAAGSGTVRCCPLQLWFVECPTNGVSVQCECRHSWAVFTVQGGMDLGSVEWARPIVFAWACSHFRQGLLCAAIWPVSRFGVC